MKVATAEVKYPAGKTFTTEYGDRQNLVLTAGGNEFKVWFKAGDTRYVGFKRGDQVTAILNGDKATIAIPDDEPDDDEYENEPTPAKRLQVKTVQVKPAAAATAADAPSGLVVWEDYNPEQKKAIARYVDRHAAIYAYCLKSALAVLPDGFSEETARCMASSLFISACKKFKL